MIAASPSSSGSTPTRLRSRRCPGVSTTSPASPRSCATASARTPSTSSCWRTSEATRSAVTTHLSEHLGRATAQDVALFYFSGHGSQQATPGGALADRARPPQRDARAASTAAPPAAGTSPTRSSPPCSTASRPPAATRSSCLDCCHSGDGTRDADEVVRLAPRRPPGQRPRRHLRRAARTDADGRRRPRRRGAGRSGGSSRAARRLPVVREGQGGHRRRAPARRAVGGARGAPCSAATAGPSYRDVLRMVTADVTSRVTDQHPQVETADATELDRPFLGGAIPATPRPLTLSRLPDGWSIDSGAVHGVPEPIGDDTTELAVYPLTGETSGSPLATALGDQGPARPQPRAPDARSSTRPSSTAPSSPRSRSSRCSWASSATPSARPPCAAPPTTPTRRSSTSSTSAATAPSAAAPPWRTCSSRPPRKASSSPVPASRAPSCPSSRARGARSGPSSRSSASPAGSASRH